MISVCGLKKIHTLSQCEDSGTFKDMDGDVEKGYFSSVYGSMNSHNELQQNNLKSLMNYNDTNDTDINYTLQNGDVSSGIGLLNIHTLSQDK